jgi:trehalose 6-phosphate phosphatase
VQARGEVTEFLRCVAEAPARLLMLDYDGTLAPLVVDRLQAHPYPGVLARLERLAREDCSRVVLVSGRPVEELMSLVPLSSPLEIWGSHGWERRLPGSRTVTCIPEKLAREALDEARKIGDALGLSSCIERKPASLALHWRGVADNERHLLAQARWEAHAPDWQLRLVAFDGGVELRVAGQGKDVVVRTLLSEMPAGTVAAFLGDDATDEDAFVALGGAGLSVLVRGRPRETRASVRITPPEGVLCFLDRWEEASRGGSSTTP